MNSWLKPTSLQLTSSRAVSRRHRPHDLGPGADYSGRDVIGQRRKLARDTEEGSLVRSVSLVDGAAHRTGAGGVARIDVDYGHACQAGLWAGNGAVFDLAVANTTEADKVAQGVCFLGRREDEVRDAVVNIHGPALFCGCLSAERTAVAVSLASRLASLAPASASPADCRGSPAPVGVLASGVNTKVRRREVGAMLCGERTPTPAVSRDCKAAQSGSTTGFHCLRAAGSANLPQVHPVGFGSQVRSSGSGRGNLLSLDSVNRFRAKLPLQDQPDSRVTATIPLGKGACCGVYVCKPLTGNLAFGKSKLDWHIGSITQVDKATQLCVPVSSIECKSERKEASLVGWAALPPRATSPWFPRRDVL